MNELELCRNSICSDFGLGFDKKNHEKIELETVKGFNLTGVHRGVWGSEPSPSVSYNFHIIFLKFGVRSRVDDRVVVLVKWKVLYKKLPDQTVIKSLMPVIAPTKSRAIELALLGITMANLRNKKVQSVEIVSCSEIN